MAIAIGICAALERASWGPWTDQPAALLPRTYLASLQRAGALALLLAPDDAAAESPDDLLDRIDGLLLAGGADIDPASYGARPHPETVGSSPERDRFELSLTHRALERDMPVLGICRGLQLLNVALGGTLVQHLPDTLGHDGHAPTPGSFVRHEVRLEPGSLAERAAGSQLLEVSSHHHQGIDELGDGLVVTGHAIGDEATEAIELPDRQFALGVQWHPEEDVASRVVGALVAAAKNPSPRPAMPQIVQTRPR